MVTFSRTLVLLLGLAFSGVFSLAAAGVEQSASQAMPKRMPLPYDLAFDRVEFAAYSGYRVSADGSRVAYTIVESGRSFDFSGFEDSLGVTPGFAVGASVHVSELPSRQVRAVCADAGNSWFPEWSPDGRTLAFYGDSGGVQRVWLYDAQKRSCHALNSGAFRTWLPGTGRLLWSADGNRLYVPAGTNDENIGKEPAPQNPLPSGVRIFMTDEVGSSEASETTEWETTEWDTRSYRAAIGVIEIAGDKLEILVSASDPSRPSAIERRVSPSGRWMSFWSVPKRNTDPAALDVTVDLYVVAVNGGPPERIVGGLPLSGPGNRESGNYRWHPSEDVIVYSQGKSFWMVRLGKEGLGKPKRLASTEGNQVYGFTQDGAAVLAGGGRNLVHVPLAGGKPTSVDIIDQDDWVIEELVRADKSVLWQPTEDAVVAKLRDMATGQVKVIQQHLFSGKQTVLLNGDLQIGNLSPSPDQRSLFAVFEDFHTAPDIVQFTADFGRRTRITAIEPRLDQFDVGTKESFETVVPMFDGSLKRVRSIILLPPGAKKGDRLPAIVHIYPGTWAPTINRYAGGIYPGEPPWLFTSRGYAYLWTRIDLAPTGEPSHPSANMVDGLLPLIYQAAALGYIDPERIGLRGQSYGGYGTAAVITETNIFRAAVASNGMFDLGDHYGRMYTDQLAAPNLDYSYWESGQGRMGHPLWDNPQRYIDNSPYYRADRINTPLLLIYGSGDGLVTAGEKMFKALKRLGKPAELAIYEGAGHYIASWKDSHAIDAAQRIMAFYEKYLGPGWTPAAE